MTPAAGTSVVRFADQLADARSVEELQRRSLESLGQLVERCAFGVYVMHPGSGTTASVAARGVGEYFLSRYEDVGRVQDPVFQRAIDTRRLATNQAFLSTTEWQALPIYRDVCALHDLTHVAHVPMLDGDDLAGMIALGRHAGAGRFSDTELGLVEALARLVSAAAAAARARAAAERQVQRLQLALELGEEAVLITDLQAADRTANAAARRLLGQVTGLDGGVEDAITVPAAAAAEEQRTMPVRLREGGVGLLRVRSIRADDPSLVVSFLSLEHPAAPPVNGMLAALTPRERDVAELVSLGLRDAEIADQLFLSPYTVTKYLAAMYRKLGMRSRVELARAVLGEAPKP